MDIIDDPNKIEKLLIAKATLNKIPLSASFEITPFCNFKCNMCFIRMDDTEIKKNGGIKDLDFWVETAKSLKKIGTLFILLTGGEPLLYPDFDLLYTTLRELGFVLTINTNGSCITDNTINLFKIHKPRRINVTLYGATNETYLKLCNSRIGFDKTIKSLELLTQNNIDVKLNVSIVKENVHELYDIIKIGEFFKIPIVINSYMFPSCRVFNKNINICKSRLSAEVGGKIEALSINYRKGDEAFPFFKSELEKLNIPNLNNRGLHLTCRAGSSQVWITWQGKMIPCVMMDYPSISLSKKSNIKEAWDELKKCCQLLPNLDDCKNCNLKKICQVCYASAIAEKKYYGNLDYLCKYTDSEIKMIKNILNEKK